MMARLCLLLGAGMLAGSAPTRDVPTSVDVISSVNLARAAPSNYADLLSDLRPNYKGNIYRDREIRNGLITQEGVKALDEAVIHLRGLEAVPVVQRSDLLDSAALAHVLEQGPRGGIGHLSADGSGPRDRIRRLGGDVYIAETITYGAPSAAAVVRQLTIDDGVRDRGHRRIMFSAEYRYAGAACGPHKTFGTMCVIEFSKTSNGAP